jgi:hypothetical protein
MRRLARWAAGGVGLAAAGYTCWVANAWSRYGQPRPGRGDEADALLDWCMPVYEVAERHRVTVAAPPDVTLNAAMAADLQASPIVRAIIQAREVALGAYPAPRSRPAGLLAETEALGWRPLAIRPGREIVMGAVTRPWLADVVFEGLPPDEFVRFDRPGYVKIAWTLRADPAGGEGSVFRTETRVMTTDAESRARFRWYWARFSPGIVAIRQLLVWQVRREAERAWAALRSAP